MQNVNLNKLVKTLKLFSEAQLERAEFSSLDIELLMERIEEAGGMLYLGYLASKRAFRDRTTLISKLLRRGALDIRQYGKTEASHYSALYVLQIYNIINKIVNRNDITTQDVSIEGFEKALETISKKHEIDVIVFKENKFNGKTIAQISEELNINKGNITTSNRFVIDMLSKMYYMQMYIIKQDKIKLDIEKEEYIDTVDSTYKALVDKVKSEYKEKLKDLDIWRNDQLDLIYSNKFDKLYDFNEKKDTECNNDYTFVPIDILDLDINLYNILMRSGIRNIGELKSRIDLRGDRWNSNIKNLGRVRAIKIEEALREYLNDK